MFGWGPNPIIDAVSSCCRDRGKRKAWGSSVRRRGGRVAVEEGRIEDVAAAEFRLPQSHLHACGTEQRTTRWRSSWAEFPAGPHAEGDQGVSKSRGFLGPNSWPRAKVFKLGCSLLGIRRKQRAALRGITASLLLKWDVGRHLEEGEGGGGVGGLGGALGGLVRRRLPVGPPEASAACC